MKNESKILSAREEAHKKAVAALNAMAVKIKKTMKKTSGLTTCLLLMGLIVINYFHKIGGASEAVLYLFANNGKLSGRMGGDVKMRNGRSRGFRIPALVRNLYTTAVRATFAGLSSAFRTLSPSQIAGWNNAAGFTRTDRFAQVFVLKGKQLYIALNTALMNVGQPVIDDAPVPVGVPQPVDLTLVAGAALGTFTVSALGVIGPDLSAVVFATRSLSAGINRPSQSAFRLIATLAPSSVYPAVLAAEYATKFGALIEGANVFVQIKYVNINTGEMSAISETQTVVGA